MRITHETLINTINALLDEERSVEEDGPIYSMIEDTEESRMSFAGSINQQVTEMTMRIAEDMGKEAEVPALAVAADAHTLAITHVALIMLAAGWKLKTDQMLAADSLTEGDIDAAIASILGGSNE